MRKQQVSLIWRLNDKAAHGEKCIHNGTIMIAFITRAQAPEMDVDETNFIITKL